jgi:hydrogenase maturation protease
MRKRNVLIAGVGNIFLADDGFGVSVIDALRDVSLPAGTRIVDFGIRGVHLAYELMDREYALLVLVNAMARGGSPGTLYWLEPDVASLARAPHTGGLTLDPTTIFSLLKGLGAACPPVLILGCEPQSCDETLGLTPLVKAAVPEAVRMIRELAANRWRLPQPLATK